MNFFFILLLRSCVNHSYFIFKMPHINLKHDSENKYNFFISFHSSPPHHPHSQTHTQTVLPSLSLRIFVCLTGRNEKHRPILGVCILGRRLTCVPTFRVPHLRVLNILSQIYRNNVHRVAASSCLLFPDTHITTLFRLTCLNIFRLRLRLGNNANASINIL